MINPKTLSSESVLVKKADLVEQIGVRWNLCLLFSTLWHEGEFLVSFSDVYLNRYGGPGHSNPLSHAGIQNAALSLLCS
jgi:hypothetical protein